MSLTKAQQEVLDYIRQCVHERGYPPTTREICAAMGWQSSASAHKVLIALQKAGVIYKEAGMPRAITIRRD